MIDFSMIPITCDPVRRAEMEREVWTSCSREGRIARRLGMGLDDCPPFRDSDMEASWRMGWHREDDEIRQKEARHG